MDPTKYTNSVGVGDRNYCSRNIAHSFNTNNFINNTTDDTPEIMQWLSPLEPHSRHQGVRSDRLDGIGNWLLETNEFREWRSGEGGVDKAVLFCHGNPGVGKTYLNCLVMDHLYDRAREEEITVAGVYCDFREQQEQTTANVIGAIHKQLVLKYQGILEPVRTEFLLTKKESGRRPQLGDHVRMLKTAISSLPQVFLCFDALDEFTPKQLPELLISLREIIREIPSVRVFFTGRSHVEQQITRHMEKAVTIPIIPDPGDIHKYVEKKLELDIEPQAMNNALKADIIMTIREKIAETFLLVSLVIGTILAEVTISDRREKLNEMTKGNGLEDAYTITLARMKAQSTSRPRLGLEALMWVSNAERPLQVDELCHALGVKIGSTDLDHENIPAIQTLLGCSLGLISVEKSSSTVRLVHYTLQEYLVNNPTLFQSPHSRIAEVCFTYLNFRSIRDLSPTLDSAPPTTPLLDYASCYWGSPARKEMTENTNSLATKVLDDFDQCISSQLLLLRYEDGRKWWHPGFRSKDGPTGFSGLHGAAYFGIAETVTTLLNMNKGDVNATDCTGTTALIWAARRGYEEVVKILLGRDNVNPNTADTTGRTPLSWAAGNGHPGVVKMLLERKDVNPNTVDSPYGQTPLSWAAWSGNEEVVKIFLERKDVNLNPADADGGTPLSWAAGKGHLGVVKMLLERKDVNPNTVDTPYGQTPLLWAAWSGNEEVVKIFLERKDVNPNTADTDGRTPLSWAAGNGHLGAVKMLLERNDVNPNSTGIDGRTPLSWAAGKGHLGVVKMLLERKDVNPNTADISYGQTPLSWAAEGGYEEVVKLLLERDDVDPNAEDPDFGQTPLSFAVQNAHVAVVRLLLEREDLNPNPAETDDGRTPLMWASEEGHDKVVEMLLARHDLNLHTTDFSGETALLLAASKGHSAVVKLLSQHNHSLTNSSHINEAPEHPSPELSDLPQPSSQLASQCPRLPTDFNTTPLDIDAPPERASPELFDLPSSVPLDLPQPTPQPIPLSASRPTDPDTTPPDSRSPLKILFGSCICWNRHNSRR